MQDFRKVFPCPNERVKKKEIKKLLEKKTQREKVPPELAGNFLG